MRVDGKGPFPEAGELTGTVLLDGISTYLHDAASDLMPPVARAPNAPPVLTMPELTATVPARPPSFCIGLPQSAQSSPPPKLVEEELGPHHIASDIGCHLFFHQRPLRYWRDDDGLWAWSCLGLGFQ